jgi:hypothetical protein
MSVCIAGCATPPSTEPSATVTALRTTVIPPDSVRDAITIGKSTRAEVIAALGETLVITFDSGFEVWVYRLARDTPAKQGVARTGPEKERRGSAAEFVVLFAPSGLVAKTRMRPAQSLNTPSQ